MRSPFLRRTHAKLANSLSGSTPAPRRGSPTGRMIVPAPTGCVRKFKALIVLSTLFSLVLSLDGGWASLLSRVTLQSQKLKTKNRDRLLFFYLVCSSPWSLEAEHFFHNFLRACATLLALHLPDAGFHTHTVPSFTSQARLASLFPLAFFLAFVF